MANHHPMSHLGALLDFHVTPVWPAITGGDGITLLTGATHPAHAVGISVLGARPVCEGEVEFCQQFQPPGNL